MVETVLFDCMGPVTLKTANQSFPVKLWPMMMHHHAKFAYKRFSSSEGIIKTNTEILNFGYDLGLQCSI